MIISISGDPGSGKSTVGKLLAVKLQYDFFSVGDLRGKMAQERGLDINEFNKLGEKECFTDKEVDEYQKKLGKERDNFVIDGKLSFYFIPKSIKIFLTVDIDEAAKRIFNDSRKDEKYDSIREAKMAIHERIRSDKRRYKKWYGVDPSDQSQYNLIFDTTNKTPDMAVKEIFDFLKRK